MYCENCGYKLNDTHLFCENCGNKINRFIPTNSENAKKSNKTVWIILGCVFGGLFLLFAITIFFLVFFAINVNNSVEEAYEEYEINDYYEYEDINNYNFTEV